MVTATLTVVDVLNKQLANWSVLFTKLHNYHWFVKGNQFFTLHAKFEELYNEAALHIDDLAERVLQLNGRPHASLSVYLKEASIKEASGNENAGDMVKQLINDFELMIDELKRGMKTAQEANDETSSDMLLAIHSSIDKHRWMLASFLA